MKKVIAAVLLLTAVAGFDVSAGSQRFPDIARIGPVPPKGRIQDTSRSSVVAALVKTGPAVIPFLVSKLEDNTEVNGHIFDYWPWVAVGDVAFVLLVDFFTNRDGVATVPGLTFDGVLGRTNQDVPAWDLLSDFVRQNGRAGLKREVERTLNLDKARYAWDASEQCFSPALANR